LNVIIFEKTKKKFVLLINIYIYINKKKTKSYCLFKGNYIKNLNIIGESNILKLIDCN